jgi:hypothetical protein
VETLETLFADPTELAPLLDVAAAIGVPEGDEPVAVLQPAALAALALVAGRHRETQQEKDDRKKPVKDAW